MKIVDLSLAFNNNIAGFRVSSAKTIKQDGWNASTLSFYSHAGTHMDAPYHFAVSEKTIDDQKLEKCISKAWLVDIPDCKPSQIINVSDLKNIIEKFKAGDSLVFRTGWSNYLNMPKYRDELPRIGKELAVWCVDNSVNMLGVEPPSVANVNDIYEVTQIHKILMKGEITIVEGLCNLDKIDKDCFTLYAIPLKIEGGDGSPVRAFAILD